MLHLCLAWRCRTPSSCFTFITQLQHRITNGETWFALTRTVIERGFAGRLQVPGVKSSCEKQLWNSPINPESVGARLQAMNDAQLKRFGEAAAYMCTPEGNLGKPAREDFVIQLREARAE
jgi:hypothetical protein